MLGVGVSSASGDDTEGGVLDGLEFGEVCIRDYGRPDGAPIFNDWSNYGFVGGAKCFLVFAP